MLFEELKDETVLFEENAELRQLVEAYGTVSKKQLPRTMRGCGRLGRTASCTR